MQEKSDLKLLSRWCHLVAISVFFFILKGKQTHLPSHRMSVNAVPVGYLSHKFKKKAFCPLQVNN